MEKEDERKTVTEFGVLCFVTPRFHAQISSETATKKGDGDQTSFGNPPFIVAGFPFINAIEEEGNDVDCHEIEQKGKDYFSH